MQGQGRLQYAGESGRSLGMPNDRFHGTDKKSSTVAFICAAEEGCVNGFGFYRISNRCSSSLEEDVSKKNRIYEEEGIP